MSFPVPPRPEPYTVEIELTNHCNASCSFCPHSRMTRAKGFFAFERFPAFLAELSDLRAKLWLNATTSSMAFPRIVFAGLGDPTLHPRLPEFVRACSDARFETMVVTNGYKLGARLAEDLVAAGLDVCAISLHSVNPDHYRRLMGLDLRRTLARLDTAFPVFAAADTRVELWRVAPPPGEPRDDADDEARFAGFCQRFPFVRVLGPSEPWERDGQVPTSPWPTVHDSDPVWCHKLYFTLNVAWDGTAVMCCVDFHRMTQPLGNVFVDGLHEVQRRRAQVFHRPPELCTTCRRWPDNEYAERVVPQLVQLRRPSQSIS